MLEGVHVQSVGAKAGHDAGSAGTAEGLLAIGRIKSNSPLRQAVEVGSFDLWISVDSEIAVHVICGNEEDIEFFSGVKGDGCQKG